MYEFWSSIDTHIGMWLNPELKIHSIMYKDISSFNTSLKIDENLSFAKMLMKS